MRPPLDLRLQNSSKRIADDLWDWTVWLEGPDAALDQIASVRYALHHTFPHPVRLATDRARKFALKSRGWGEFLIGAEITPKSGTPFLLERWLTLAEGAPPDAEPERLPTVFISSAATDARLVRSLKDELAAQGVRAVIPEDDLDPGTPWRVQTAEMIKRSDVVAVVLSGELRDIAELDVQTALKANKPIIPIVVGNGSLPKSLEHLEKVELKNFGKTEAIVDMLCARVKDAFYPDESIG
jgi:TIR domain/YEATS family